LAAEAGDVPLLLYGLQEGSPCDLLALVNALTCGQEEMARTVYSHMIPEVQRSLQGAFAFSLASGRASPAILGWLQQIGVSFDERAALAALQRQRNTPHTPPIAWVSKHYEAALEAARRDRSFLQMETSGADLLHAAVETAGIRELQSLQASCFEDLIRRDTRHSDFLGLSAETLARHMSYHLSCIQSNLPALAFEDLAWMKFRCGGVWALIADFNDTSDWVIRLLLSKSTMEERVATVCIFFYTAGNIY
jgi:hypothetical protein